MICPQCGFEQPEAAECARCGVRVDLYRKPEQPPAPPPSNYGGGFVGVGAIYGIPPDVVAPDAAAAPSSPASLPPHLETGPTLHDSFAVFFANFLPFVAISFLALLPRLAVAAFFPTLQSTTPPKTPAEIGHSCLSLLLVLGTQTLGSQLAAGAITDGVLRHLRGAEVAVGESLGVALRAMGRVLGVAFLAGLGILLGFCACIVPGIVLMVQWSVAVPVALEERPGIGASIYRSGELTKGSRWPIFCILLVIGLLNLGLVRLVVIAMGSLTSFRPDLVETFVSVPLTGLSGTASAVIYYRLRSLKESIDVRHLASVFD